MFAENPDPGPVTTKGRASQLHSEVHGGSVVQAPARAKILVVDDSRMTRRKIRFFLECEGYEVFEAKSGEETLWLAPECHPDLVLLDVGLEGMDGFETCARLKRCPGFEEVPVIFVTSSSAADCIARGFQSGASDYIAKPFNTLEALPRIRTHLKMRQMAISREQHIQALEHANRCKVKLLRAASHDLRNPLSAIAGLAEFLDDGSVGQLTADQQEVVSSIRSAAANMTTVLDGLREILINEKGPDR